MSLGLFGKITKFPDPQNHMHRKGRVFTSSKAKEGLLCSAP